MTKTNLYWVFLPLLLYLSLSPVSLVYSQLPSVQNTNNATIRAYNTIYLDDLFKQPFRQNAYTNIKGSPFYLADWKLADIEFNDGKQYSNVPVKLNLYTQELICLSPDKSEIIIKDGITKSLLLKDTAETGELISHHFISGLSVADKDLSHAFFEMLTDGKAKLLRLTKKKIIELKDALSHEAGKEFTKTETHYIYHNGELQACEKNTGFFIRVFSDKKNLIEHFINTKKLKCRRPEEMALLTAYYNSL